MTPIDIALAMYLAFFIGGLCGYAMCFALEMRDI